LEEYKGVQDVLRILPELLNDHPDLRFLVVGRDYGHKERLIRLTERLGLSRYVIFCGPVADSLLVQILSASTVFAFPSRLEAFGIALAEAMALGVPCVAYDIPAVREVLDFGRAGLLFNSVSQLGQSVAALLENPVLRDRLSKRARIRASKFSTRSVVDRLEALYQQVVEVKPP
jgi:glycosyltransferase involved in cell wall biosynthesis